MSISDTYKSIKTISYGNYREKGSRFNAAAFPVSEISEVRQYIEETRKKNHDARHNCFAYVLGTEGDLWRANDDGEPSGTAGRPILGQIRAYNLTNVLIIVSRYFGGTLLGVGGLIQAYKSAAGNALENSVIIDRLVKEYYKISFPYSRINDVMKIIKEENIDQSGHIFDNECCINISFRLSLKQEILHKLSLIEHLSCQYLRTI